MDYISDVDTKTLKVTAVAKLGILTINYDIPPEYQDACQSLKSGDCPVRAGEPLTYELDMPLKAPMTGIKPLLRVSLRDDNNNHAVCFGIKIHIEK